MKFFAGFSAAALLVAGLSVASAPANAAVSQADEYTPTINTFCLADAGRAERRKIKVSFAIATNGAGVPNAKVRMTVRNRRGAVVDRRVRRTSGEQRNFQFRNVRRKGRYTVSFVATPTGKAADRYKQCTARVATRVRPRKR